MTTAAVLIAALLGGGVWAFLGTLLKYRPSSGEAATTIVQLADRAVVVQSSVIDDLTDQMALLRHRIEDLEREVHDLSGHLDSAKRERDLALLEVARLRAIVDAA